MPPPINAVSRKGLLRQVPRICLFMLLGSGLSTVPALAGEAAENGAADDAAQWWRGNLHTHTVWSDGDDFPENVAKWYKENGYDFLAFTDHNILLEGEKWRRFHRESDALVKYLDQFGEDWVVTRPVEEEDHVDVRLRGLSEFRDMFEEPGKFQLIMGNEITNHHSVHLLAHDQMKLIPTVEGTPFERARMIQDVVDLVDEYRASSGRNVHAILAHPNWQWAITAEMMLAVDNLRFFEVYNGHPGVNNTGDDFRAGTERMWDIVLANRLADGGGRVLHGVATDDSHNYHGGWVGPGRGWVMVRSSELTTAAILDALDAGDFYGSTGVTLADVRREGDTLHIVIEAEEGVEYVTEYIGTRRGFDPESTPTLDADGNEITNTTRTYSDTIGEVLHRTGRTTSSYTLTEEDLYLRARVTSTADQLDPVTGAPLGPKQQAWVQPITHGR